MINDLKGAEMHSEIIILILVCLAYLPLHETCHILMLKFFKKRYYVRVGIFIRIYVEDWSGRSIKSLPLGERLKLIVTALAPYVMINLPVLLLLPSSTTLLFLIKLYYGLSMFGIPLEFL